ncbi:SDR family oxidoreductase [Rhodoblastus sp.]|uniref:SDR family NAD(P)-dependent oxidoreductase n=1 Tax=Rhodoblastus sp. TaxID=1962975 RepID=UPI002623AEA4|nr:SDR family oxidoreductase [Rhodoblastus sp.]
MGKIVILGATGAVGAVLARRLAESGARLHLVARDAERLADLARATTASWSVADALDESALAAAIDEAGQDLFGLVNAIGSLALKPLSALNPAQIEQDFRINALSSFIAVKAGAAALRKGQGSVVLFSTVAARNGFPFHVSVAMAKAAVEGLALSLAAELAPHVRVNVVAPSLMRTPLAGRLASQDASARAIVASHALGRLGEAEDAAALAEFLLSSQAGWITGQIIGCDGGRSTLSAKG